MSGSFESVRWNACVHRLDLGLYSHPKEFLRNGVRNHVNSKLKIPSTGNFSSEKDGSHDAASSRTASPTHYQRTIQPPPPLPPAPHPLPLAPKSVYHHKRRTCSAGKMATLLRNARNLMNNDSVVSRVELSCFRPTMFFRYLKTCSTWRSGKIEC